MSGGVPEKRSPAEAPGWAERLLTLRDLLARRACDRDALLRDFLSVATDLFGLDHSVITAFEGDAVRILACWSRLGASTLEPGQTFTMGDTFAGEVARSQGTVAVHNVRADPRFRLHPFASQRRPEVYLSSPIWSGATLFGTISLWGDTPRQDPFEAGDVAFLELIGQTLGNIVERERLDQDRRRADQQRRDASTLLSTAFAHAPIGMALVGLDGRFLQVNGALCRLLGRTEQDLLARDFQSVTCPDDLALDLAEVAALASGQASEYHMEKRYLHKDGRPIWADLSVAMVRGEDGAPRCFVSQIQGIDEQKLLLAELQLRREELEAANRELARLASVDALTGVLNRRALRTQLDRLSTEAARRGRPLAFLMVDVDNFKLYNDRYGHLEGDDALKVIAEEISAATRATDVVGRFGGEEFLVLLIDADVATAKAIAERIRAQVEHSAAMRDRVTVSIGVHVRTPSESGDTIKHSIEQADTALYRAKRNGRNRVEMF